MLDSVFLVAYDLRGNGRSGKPETEEGYTKERYAQDFWAVCGAFEVTNPVALGWCASFIPFRVSALTVEHYRSLGGLTIADVLTSSPPTPSHGLIAAIYIGGPVPTRAFHMQYASMWLAETLPHLLSDSAEMFTRTFPKFIDGCMYDPQKSITYEEKARMVGEATMSPNVTRILIEKCSRSRDSPTWEDELRKLPKLIIQGREDLLVDGDKCRKAFMDTFKDNLDWVWVEKTGHTPFWEHPEEVEDYIIAFVKKAAKSNTMK